MCRGEGLGAGADLHEHAAARREPRERTAQDPVRRLETARAETYGGFDTITR